MLAKSSYFVLTTRVLPGLILLFFCTFLIYFFFFSSFFYVKQIECLADYTPCQNVGLLAELEYQKGISIFRVKSNVLEQKILKGDYLTREVKVIKDYPNTLHVIVNSVQKVLAISVKGSPKGALTVDQEGRVISYTELDPNLTVLLLDNLPPQTPGQKVKGDGIDQILETALALSQTGLVISTISPVDTGSLELTLRGYSPHVLITTFKPLETQIQSLQAILGDSTMIANVRMIDVRFSQPVLKK